jgi:uncharacterized phiE125 gp8 family phage protein
MTLLITTPPTALPLHIAEVRHHLREDLPENDSLITNIYFPEAIDGAMLETQKQLVAARYLYTLDCFQHCIRLPIAPLIQVASVQYIATDGTTQTMPSTDYTVGHAFGVATITPAYGKSWPATRWQTGAVMVSFDAGYVAPFVADAAANTVSFNGWKALVVGDAVRLSNSGGVLPAPLKAKADYYVQSVVSPGVYTLSATVGGGAVDIADAGAGLHFIGQTGLNGGNGEIPGAILSWMLLQIETRYSYRGGLINTPGSIVAKNPFIDGLLDPYRVVLP